jgi:hypothetical protein
MLENPLRARRLTLPAALAALTLALATMATPAMADPGGATIDPIMEPVAFSSPSSGQVPMGYTCPVPDTGGGAAPLLDVGLTQSNGSATGSATAVCDGTHHTADVALTGAGMVSDDAHVLAHLDDQTLDEIVTVDVAPAPAISLDGDVLFSDATHGSVTVDYLCRGDTSTLGVAIAGTPSSRTASGSVQVLCDGLRETATVPLTAGAPGFDPAGTYQVEVSATIPQQASLVATADLRSKGSPQPPAPVKATVDLTTNASPEKVTKGKKITVGGTVRRDGKKVALKTTLQFRQDGDDDYARVKSVTSSKKGALETTVKASRSGSFRYVYAGSSTTEPATSAGDHIVVVKPKPKPKKYKNCTALRKVYPHGVGRSGAHDKGGDVTDFTRDTKTYNKNKKSDRDKDGIACEA